MRAATASASARPLTSGTVTLEAPLLRVTSTALPAATLVPAARILVEDRVAGGVVLDAGALADGQTGRLEGDPGVGRGLARDVGDGDLLGTPADGEHDGAAGIDLAARGRAGLDGLAGGHAGVGLLLGAGHRRGRHR